MVREVIKGSGTPAPMAYYCEGVLAGETLYAAGQIASDYKTGVSLLRLGHREAGALHPRQPAESAAGRRMRPEGRGEVPGVPHRPGRLLPLRPGLEGALPLAAATHHGP